MEQSSRLRYAIPFFVVSFFLLYFFSSGVQTQLSPGVLKKGSGPLLPQVVFPWIADLLSLHHTGLPDFGKYRHIGTLSAERLSLGHMSPSSPR